MGVYVYRITKQTIICNDGEKANVAIFAFKPTFSGWDSDKQNNKWRFQTGCVAAERMAQKGNITDRFVMAYKGVDNKLVIDSPVYGNRNNLGSFYDDDLGSEFLPRLSGIYGATK